MVKELPSAAKEGEILTDVQGLMAKAGFTPDTRGMLSKLSEMSGLARVFIWQISRGRSEPNPEQKEKLVEALQQLIEERKARGELKDIVPPPEDSRF